MTFREEYGDADEDEPMDPVKRTLLYGTCAVFASYMLLFFLFKDPRIVFGNMDPIFLDLYRLGFLLAVAACLYVLNSVRQETAPGRRRAYAAPVKLLLVGAALWIPILYAVEKLGTEKWYSSAWFVVATRVAVAIAVAQLTLLLRDPLREDHFGTIALYYLLFHTVMVDGMVWCYSYVIE